MCYNMSLSIEAKDTAALNGTPYHALIAFTNGSRCGTDTIALGQKAPCRKLGLDTGNHHQTFRQAAQPDITIAVFLDTPYCRVVQVQAVQGAFHPDKLPASSFQQEEAIATRTYIYITVTVFVSTTNHHILTAESRHVNVCISHDAIVITTDAVLTDN